MTTLTTYTATFRTDQASANEEVKASSPAAALTKARALANERRHAFHFEPYIDPLPINEIAVESEDGDAEWLDDGLRLRLAARDLLNALEKAVTALNTAARFKVPRLDCDSHVIAAECRRAIAKARSENNPNAA